MFPTFFYFQRESTEEATAWYLETNLLQDFSHLDIWAPDFSICKEKAELHDSQTELAHSFQ